MRSKRVATKVVVSPTSENLRPTILDSDCDEKVDRVEDLIRYGLHKRLDELHRELGVDDLTRSDLTKRDLRAISDRMNQAMDSLTGVRADERALVWLDMSMRLMATSAEGDAFTPGATATVPNHVVLSFFRDATEHFPWLQPLTEVETPVGRERVLDMSVFARCLAGYVRMRHRGRPRQGWRELPKKWEAFHDLAVHVGLIVPQIGIEELKRILRRARLKLRQARNPLRKG